MLKEKADTAEKRLNRLRDENQRLRAELELAKEGMQDLGQVRRRYEATTAELEVALRDVAGLRAELRRERELEEQNLRQRVEHCRQHLSRAHSPQP